MEEPIDKWLNERLEDLPETVPFDPEALWKSVQQAQKAPRGRRWMWPAAVLAMATGLFALTWFISAPEKMPVAARSVKPASVPAPLPEAPAAAGTPQPVAASARPATRPRALEAGPPAPVAVPIPEVQPEEVRPAEATVPLPEVAAAPAPEAQKAAAPPVARPGAAKISRPRFRISHINDLREEEETREKVYKSESFVRMGVSEVSPGPSPSLSTRHKQF